MLPLAWRNSRNSPTNQTPNLTAFVLYRMIQIFADRKDGLTGKERRKTRSTLKVRLVLSAFRRGSWTRSHRSEISNSSCPSFHIKDWEMGPIASSWGLFLLFPLYWSATSPQLSKSSDLQKRERNINAQSLTWKPGMYFKLIYLHGKYSRVYAGCFNGNIKKKKKSQKQNSLLFSTSIFIM